MEDYVILASIMMFGGFGLLAMKMFQGKGKTKTRLNSAQDVLTKTYETNIERLSVELRKQTGRASRLQALRDGELAIEEEELTKSGNKQVTWEEIQTLVKNQAPKYAMMLPLVKKQIMQATEGMSMEEILNYVKQFTGNKESKGETPPESATYNPNWA